MDSAQFTQFMKSQQEMMAQLVQMVATTGKSEAASHSSNVVQKFDIFDSEKESYRNYIQRFANYVELNKVTHDKEYCAKLLLNSIGAANFSLVTALAAPKAPAELSYDELQELLERHNIIFFQNIRLQGSL